MASVACDGMESPKAYGITRSVYCVGLIPYIPFGMIPYLDISPKKEYNTLAA